MPTISVFYGIKIFMPPKDHNPPHFHVKYNEFNAIINIETGLVMNGRLPLKARLLVEEWRMIHKKEIKVTWSKLSKLEDVKQIPGLE